MEINPRYIVPCRVIDSQGKPISGLRIEAFDQDPISPHDPLGEAAITNPAGMVEFRFLGSDFTEHPGEEGPDLYFKVYRGNILLQYILPLDNNDKGVMRRFQPQRAPITIQVAKHCLVEGRVLRQNGLPAEKGLKLFIYNRGFGGVSTLLGNPKTDENGYYALVYDPGAAVINLEVRIKDPQNYETEISLAKTKFNAGAHQVLNLVVPSAQLKAEYQRLEEDLIPHVVDMGNLAEARENADRQDLTVLNRATGWDARIIALAAKAASVSAQDVGLSQEVLYGLFRAGLPTDRAKLGCINPQTVGEALLKARDAGIIGLTNDQIKEASNRFEAFANSTRLSIPAPGSNTTYLEMLNTAGIGANLDEIQRTNLRARFAEVYLNHHGDPVQLWEKASEAGISADDIKILQLQGKFSYLTVNSSALTTRLQKDIGISDPVQLVDKDFYQAAKWREEVGVMAGGDAERLTNLIPPGFLGDTTEDRLNAYAEDMARKIRLSYPTHVIARMLEKDNADDFKLGSTRYDTVAFLRNAAAKGFRLGRTPVEAFLKSYPRTFSLSTTETVSESVKRTVKTLTCVYQITPSNESMQVLLNLGFTSAHDVVAIPQDDFLKRYGDKFPSPKEAELVYRKAKQVDAVTHNFFAIAKKLESEASVYVISAPVDVRETVKSAIIKQFPTMESLFGSLDFCECEHCRSVLSPAAYFVDLLQFLDKNAEHALASDWTYQMTNWPSEHGGAKYPFKNKEQEQQYLNLWRQKNPGKPDPIAKTPYEVLIERRPDLPHIPLTCENTHTALPYIDVVNEILEYYVANGKLEEKAVQDTGSAETADLLSEPANVIIEAYTKLQQARYPLAQPFDLWLETVRRFCSYFETPLWQLLEVFRPGDELFAPAQAYDRAVIFAESLGLSMTEYSIFTDPNPLSKWYELYGYNSAAQATTQAADADTGQRIDLNSAKALSRRLGISYKELVEIVQTGFVNPKLQVLVILPKLNVSISDVVYYKTHKDFYTANKDLIGKKRSALSAADQLRFDKLTEADWRILNEINAFVTRLDALTNKFKASGFNAATWLNTALQNNYFDGILLLTDPESGCNFDETTLRYFGGTPADDFAFLKINLFVRLWRKLGWSIEETDRALLAFIPKNNPFEKANLNKSTLKTTLFYLSHFKALDERLRVGKDSRLKLITLWSQLATTGKKPLYAQLFLKHNVLQSDSVFDDPLGNYLSSSGLATMALSHWYEVSIENVAPSNKIDPAAFSAHTEITVHYDALLQVQSLSYQGVLSDGGKANLLTFSSSSVLPKLLDEVQIKAREFTRIKGHLSSLQGALGLTADEINQILQDAGYSTDTELSLANVSLLYRYGLLAKALKLSIRDLISLKQLSGLDPFKPLSNDQLTVLTDDYPFTHTLRFIELAEEIKESGLKIEDLEYLLRHRFDPTGKYAPDQVGMLALIKTLAEGVRSIRAENAIPNDTAVLGEDFLRQKLGLILPPDVLERFLAMLNGTVEFTATKSPVAASAQLTQETFVSEPAIRQVNYNETKQEQKLTLRGVLFDTEKAQLKARFTSATFASLIDNLQSRQSDFFEQNLRRFFDEFAEISAIGPSSLSACERQERLLWAIGPNLALLNPSILTEEIVQENLSLILPTDVADTFSKMLDGTILYTATKTGVEAENKLNPGNFTGTNITVSYDETTKEQSLTYTGVLLESESTTLKTKYSSPVFAALQDDILKQAREFFDQNLLSFFAPSDFSVLFIPSGLSEAEKALRSKARIDKLAQAFLLYILAVDKKLWEGESLTQILKSVFSDEVMETFLKMWAGEIEYVTVKENVAITDKLDPGIFSEPNITVSYDTMTKKQTLTFKGVLLASESAQLKAQHRSSLFADLLDDIEAQARKYYLDNLQGVFSQSAFNQLFTVLPEGLNPSLKQNLISQKRSRCTRTFLTYLQQQLIRQFVLQTITAQVGADPGLVEALLTNQQLLSDPRPLLQAFVATSEIGLTATFYASVDGSGTPLATKLSSNADSSLQDKTGAELKPSGANSATFEGCLVVKTPGPYRFYAALDKKDAQVELRFEHLTEPLIKGYAESDNAEISEYLELEAGVLYPFVLKVGKLGGGNARLMFQGETLTKGALAQLTLYPKETVERAEHTLIVLKKTLQLIQALNLSEREVCYLATHSADFSGLNFSKLPTREAEIGLEELRALFSQFLRLAGYACLKRELTGGTDDLIELFETAALDKVYSLIAKLTRRDKGTVRAAAEAIFPAPSFSTELPLKRLWDALQVVERFGVPAASIAGWTKIVRGAAMPDGGFDIAKNLKESIKARYEPEPWQRVSRPIFDKLRQLQRDSLVAHVMYIEGFQRLEQLYEYFLMDPGMEPVVQTSRIRLAISTVQLFIQRSLLNLEPLIHPSVINAKQWGWMKRYRVWEANRKIFLFPENWLEPEFRDDKTHLFRELEGNLLQGDVSNDLVEDAFLNYLKKLDELARLDIVGMHCEVKSEAALNTVHVIGRTFNRPYKYFYRRYVHQMWTPWEPVTAEIEGDHIAPVVWRDRLYLFWVTFLDKTDPKASVVDPNNPSNTSKPANDMSLSDVVTSVGRLAANKVIEAQLHWSEYFQGEWSTSESSGFNTPEGLKVKATVPLSFNDKSVLIYVSKEPQENNADRGVLIHLGIPFSQAFYLAGRNSIPRSAGYQGPPEMPYSNKEVEASRYTGEGALTVNFTERITKEDGVTKPPVSSTSGILDTGGSYTLLPSDNSVKRGNPDFGHLITPVFYQDNTNTMFIEPELEERLINEWQEWVTRAPEHDPDWAKLDWLDDLVLQSVIPEFKPPILVDPDDSVWSNPVDFQANFKVTEETDWLANSMTVLQFDEQLIGEKGRTELVIQTKDEAAVTVAAGGELVDAHSGSEVPSGSIVVAVTGAVNQSGLANVSGGINIVGYSGLNPTLVGNLSKTGSVGMR